MELAEGIFAPLGGFQEMERISDRGGFKAFTFTAW